MKSEHTIDGVTIKAEGGRVYWMSDWSRCYELAQRGYLIRTFHPGHGDPCAQHETYDIPARDDGCYEDSIGWRALHFS
jgi:hypothetical protein